MLNNNDNVLFIYITRYIAISLTVIHIALYLNAPYSGYFEIISSGFHVNNTKNKNGGDIYLPMWLKPQEFKQISEILIFG